MLLKPGKFTRNSWGRLDPILADGRELYYCGEILAYQEKNGEMSYSTGVYLITEENREQHTITLTYLTPIDDEFIDENVVGSIKRRFHLILVYERYLTCESYDIEEPSDEIDVRDIVAVTLTLENEVVSLENHYNDNQLFLSYTYTGTKLKE